MFDPRKLDDIARQLANSLPEGLRHLRDDAEKNFREVLQGALSRLDLVTREEFDAQSEVLARARAQLETLSERLERLEKEQSAPRE
ncbi:accessory factor UbiK family protein [Gammaproteobacteria bacterium AB-CW1]|uniref:Ubiquinone biosynthesis accessory factor UbiK n=1 Tax=Natronospira elongata TaxID=3110268 RepID=A0AAP6MLQ9_9GAMM|nr:accessory factor UbiK family protein [Gammaproteobacteria bacterium AB-CW1]